MGTDLKRMTAPEPPRFNKKIVEHGPILHGSTWIWQVFHRGRKSRNLLQTLQFPCSTTGAQRHVSGVTYLLVEVICGGECGGG